MKKNIVVLGGGYAGLVFAMDLAKKNLSDVKITLIDREDYHLYYPDLYEIATSEEDFADVESLKKSIALPFLKFLPKNINFVKDEVTAINRGGRFVLLGSEKVSYDYLVLSMGAVSDYFNIPGMKENALTLKSFPDALRIRKSMELIFEQAAQEVQKKLLRVIVGGGGFTGTEFTGELLNLIEILCLKYNYPQEKVEVVIVEGTGQLLPGLDPELSENIRKRLENMHVLVRLNNFITKVEPGKITVNTGEIINYDLLVWTGGVKSQTLPFADKENLDRKGRAVVDDYLEVTGSGIYAIGDDAGISLKSGAFVPQTATQAIYQAEYLSNALAARIVGKTPRKFQAKNFAYIVPVRGKWAVLHFPGGITFYGALPWWAHNFAAFRYFSKLVGYWRAFKLVVLEVEIYSRND